MVVSGFYENVPRHLYERRDLQAGEAPQNLVLEFNPKPSIDVWPTAIGIGMSVAIFQTSEDFTHSKTMTKGDGSTKPP
jgi:hypothetical protein